MVVVGIKLKFEISTMNSRNTSKLAGYEIVNNVNIVII